MAYGGGVVAGREARGPGDQNYDLFVTDVASGKSTKVDHGEWEINRYAWSPDSTVSGL